MQPAFQTLSNQTLNRRVCNVVSYRSDPLEAARIDVGQNVRLRIAEDLEGDGAVMVFERRNVVIANCQLGPCVDLVTEDRTSAISVDSGQGNSPHLFCR